MYEIELIFTLLWDSVSILDDLDKVKVFQNLAWNMIDKLGAPRGEIREIFKRYYMVFEEYCVHCNRDVTILALDGPEDPICSVCELSLEMEMI
jgi:hypothetical protein